MINRFVALGGTVVVAVGLTFVACGKKDEDEKASIPSTVNVSGTLSLGSLALTDYSLLATSAPAAGDKVFCVTFAETPEAGTGTVESTGKFSLTMPGGTAMGCFLTDSARATKATFTFEDAASSAMGTSTSNSFALGKDIDFGQIAMGKDGRITIPYATISGATAAAVAAKSNGIDIDALHGKKYKIQCVSSGDSVMDAACQKDMADSPTVYFRVVKGTENGTEIRGLAAWESEEAFKACGSIDGTNAEKAAINGVTFTQFDSAAAYTASSACGMRSSSDTVRSRDTIKAYYMLSQAKVDGAGGFSTKATSPYKLSANCMLNHETSIIFTGSATNLFGAFQSGEFASAGCTDTERNNAGLYQASFNVQFTPM